VTFNIFNYSHNSYERESNFFPEWENKHGQIPLTITPTLLSSINLLLKPMEALQATGLRQADPKKLKSIKGKLLKYSEFTSTQKRVTFLLNDVSA